MNISVKMCKKAKMKTFTKVEIQMIKNKYKVFNSICNLKH